MCWMSNSSEVNGLPDWTLGWWVGGTQPPALHSLPVVFSSARSFSSIQAQLSPERLLPGWWPHSAAIEKWACYISPARG